MIKIKTNINNVRRMTVEVNNKHSLSTRIDNIHIFTTILFGATIIYMLQMFNRSKFTSTSRLAVESKVIIRDTSQLYGNLSTTVSAKTKIIETYKLKDNVNLSFEYTKPLTWDNLIVRYSTWSDVLQRFSTWEDVKTYR